MDDLQIKQMRVRVCDREHPHYLEVGRLTGKVISVLGTPMAEIKLEHCQHGTDGCFVKKGQIEAAERVEIFHATRVSRRQRKDAGA